MARDQHARQSVQTLPQQRTSPSRNRANNIIRNQGEYCFFGWCLIPDRMTGLFTELDGSWSTVTGPQMAFTWRKTFQLLENVVASPGEYLQVHFSDGKVEHIEGPHSFTCNPFLHKQVIVRKKLKVNSGYAIVVYQKNKANSVSRRVVQGPVSYTPQVHEWAEKFNWMVPTVENPADKTPLIFRKLRTIPDQLRFNIPGIRTKDDALMQCNFMIFYNLVDIQKMLNSTHDPCGDVINGTTADILNFTSRRTFEDFKYDINLLNEEQTYPQLSARMEACGYKLKKVAFTGYVTSKELQRMHDSAIETRTKLQLEKETEETRQNLQDFKQQMLHQREEKQRKHKQNEVEHKVELERLNLEKHKLKFEEDLDQKRRSQEQDLEFTRKKEEESQRHLHNLKELGVDLNEYLITKAQMEGEHRIDKKIVIQDAASGRKIHFHSKL